jgi:hypothetical protein
MDKIVSQLHSTKKHVPFFVVVITAFIFLILGSLLTFLVSPLFKNSEDTKIAYVENSDFLDGENAYVSAEIVDFNEYFVTLRKSNGQFQAYSVSEQFFVSKPGKNNQIATSAGQLASIETGHWATINLRKFDGEYRIVSILYR